MEIFELIEKNKDIIIPDLYEWAETFDLEIDDDGEKSLESYNAVFSLVQRFENGHCDRSDYVEILFHINQINFNEQKIKI